MPMPVPGEKETKAAFLERCMADEVMRREYEDSRQRYAVCRSQWERTEASEEDQS